ncbi:hypothetical protein EJB05_25432 [Eragrostis curvula]|uniref:Uncharacterized protein n=1 Tax=Eragrostis curvula TaxID=38414 RepID=A0A5J9VDX3_9POAL|nr:hypothetical protein EJB05_25432 [Eragrostis curvula]
MAFLVTSLPAHGTSTISVTVVVPVRICKEFNSRKSIDDLPGTLYTDIRQGCRPQCVVIVCVAVHRLFQQFAAARQRQTITDCLVCEDDVYGRDDEVLFGELIVMVDSVNNFVTVFVWTCQLAVVQLRCKVMSDRVRTS